MRLSGFLLLPRMRVRGLRPHGSPMGPNFECRPQEVHSTYTTIGEYEAAGFSVSPARANCKSMRENLAGQVNRDESRCSVRPACGLLGPVLTSK